jgi:hypothetical protein
LLAAVDLLDPGSSERYVADTFAEIVAQVDEPIPCDFPRCRHDAVCWGDAHGCEQAVLCTKHLMRFVTASASKIGKRGYVKCCVCMRPFTSMDAILTSRPL